MDDLTFILPVRIESIIRLENFLAVLQFLRSTKSKIIVIEADNYTKDVLRPFLPKSHSIKYIYAPDDDPVFFRTHFINMALQEVDTDIVSVWDADVVVDKKQLLASCEAIRSGQCDFSFPYNGTFLNTDMTFRQEYLRHHDIRVLLKFRNYLNILYGNKFVGGGFLIDAEKYKSSGGENENFYGWGPEDGERVQRWESLGYRIHRSEGPMFHLCHPRDINGGPRTKLYQDLCFLQINNSLYKSSNEVIQYKDKYEQDRQPSF